LTRNKQLNRIKASIGKIYPFSDECWAEIKDFISFREYQKNEYFSHQGEKIDCLGLVFSGVLRIFYLSAKGEEWNKHFLQEGDFVAAGISLHEKSITNIQALSKTKIACIPYDTFVGIAAKYSEIDGFIKKLSLSYLEQKQNREIQLLSQDALSSYLTFKRLFPNLENKIQHYHIASYLGITPTQLSRIRRKINSHQQM